jgi:hypothetical protein
MSIIARILWIAILLMFALTPVQILVGSSSADPSSETILERTGPENRSGIVPDFDVQFILDPETDPLAPWYKQKMAHLEPGTIGRYWILISNLGDHEDTYLINLSGPLPETGTNWYFLWGDELTKELTLTSAEIRDQEGGKSFTVIPMQVVIASYYNKDDLFSIKVSAVSQRDQVLYENDAPVDSDTLVIFISHVDYLSLKGWKQTIFHVDPGEWITLPLTVSNLGNKDIINITCMIDEDDLWRSTYRDFEEIYHIKTQVLEYGWTYAELSVKQGQKVPKNISVRVPLDYVGGDEVFQFRVFGRIDGTYYWSVSEIVTLIVDRYTELKASLGGEGPYLIKPGEKKWIDLNISNTFYNEDTIEGIALVDPKGIEMAVFNKTRGPFTAIEVPGKKTVTIPLEFLVGEHYPPGPVDLRLAVRARYHDPMILNFTLDVEEKSIMEILPTDPLISGVIEVYPGLDKKIVLGLRNDGNSKDIVNLGFSRDGPSNRSSHDDDWSFRTEWISQVREPARIIEMEPNNYPVDTSEFIDDLGYSFPDVRANGLLSLVIDPDETVWVCLDVVYPNGDGRHMLHRYQSRAVLSSTEGGILDEFQMIFEPRYPDLVFDDMLVLTDPDGKGIDSVKEGGKLFFSINVTNVGQAFSDRTLVRVVSEDMDVGEIPIKPLAPGGKTVLNCHFTAKTGMYGIELMLDPENLVIESDDQFMEGSYEDANIIRVPLSVQDEGDRDGVPFVVLWLPILLMLIVLVVLASFFHLRKKSSNRRNDGKSYFI